MFRGQVYNGDLLIIECVVKSFWELRFLNLFFYLECIDLFLNWVIDIFLQKLDSCFFLLFVDFCVKVLLVELNCSENFDLMFVGIGLYKVVFNDEKWLVL